MPLHLFPTDQSMLSGDRGPAAQMAMSILVRMAGVYGAAELMDISGAHIDSTIYIGEAGLQYAERLAGLGAARRRAHHAQRQRAGRAALAGVVGAARLG